MIYIIKTNNYELREQIYQLGFYDETMNLEDKYSALIVNGQDFYDEYLSNLGNEEELSEEFEDEVKIFDASEIDNFLNEIKNILD